MKGDTDRQLRGTSVGDRSWTVEGPVKKVKQAQCAGRTKVGFPELCTGRPLFGSSDYKGNVDVCM